MRKEIGVYKKAIQTTVLSTILLTTVLALSITYQNGGPQIYYVGPLPAQFAKIQDAINFWNVSNGDIIEVMPEGGPYYEHVVVNKSLTIKRWTSSTDECIVDGKGTGTVFNVTARNVKIYNLTIRNGSYGLYLHHNSSDNIIMDNKITSNDLGLLISDSGNDTLSRNTLFANTENFGITSSVHPSYIQHIDSSNTVDGKPIVFWTNEHDKSIQTNAGFVALINCTNIVARNLALSKNKQGILLAYTDNSTIENVDIRNVDTAIQLYYSHKNTIHDNMIMSNMGCVQLEYSIENMVTDNVISDSAMGIGLHNCSYNKIAGNNISSCIGWEIAAEWSSNNTFYHNNIIDSTIQVVNYESVNAWDNGAEGNYWKNYVGVDADGDGIGDTNLPHQGLDYCPLVKPWSQICRLNITLLDLLKKYGMAILCDHVVASIKYYSLYGLVTFNITAGTQGYCNVTIPRDRLDYPFDLTIENVPPISWLTVINATHCILSFTYGSGTHNIRIKSYRIGNIFSDLNNDGRVDMKDIGLAIKNFGKSVPPIISSP